MSLKACPEKEVYVFSIPNNPTGEIYSYDEFSNIVQEIKERNGFIVLDTVCSFAITKTLQPFYESLITVNDYWNSCAVVNSFSKTDSAAGLRLGYIYSSEYIVDFCSRLNASSIMNPPTFPAFPFVLTCMFRCMYTSQESGNWSLRSRFAKLFRRLFFMTSAGIPIKMRNYAEHIFSHAEEYCNEYTSENLGNEKIFSTACERSPYVSALGRLITFFESEGFES